MPELVGVVHDGGEEVGALEEDAAGLVVQAYCGGVVSGLEADENVLIGGLPGQLTQNLGQVLRTELAGSTGAVAELRQALVHDGGKVSYGQGDGQGFLLLAGRMEGCFWYNNDYTTLVSTPAPKIIPPVHPDG
ncbi:hypothetical protein ES703_05308 [subsurface metagenome]